MGPRTRVSLLKADLHLSVSYYTNKRDSSPVKRVKMKYMPLIHQCQGVLNKLN